MPSLEEAVRYLQELKQEVASLRKQVKDAADRKAISDRDQEYAMDVINAKDAWQVAEEDNVDSSNGLLIDIYIPPNGVTRHIRQVLARVRLKAFRSYSAVTATSAVLTSGSSSASSSDSQVVASSGSSSASSSDSQVVASSGASSNETTTTNSTSFTTDWASFLQGFGTVTEPDHTHGGAVAADGGHTHNIPDHYHPHSHTLAHTHNITAHTHPIPHTHDITAHTHPIPHTHTVPAHTHPITGAITLGTTASNCTIWINGNDRTVALTGAATFNTDQDELDVTQYMEPTGYNTVEVRSATNGRIRLTAFVSLYLNDN